MADDREEDEILELTEELEPNADDTGEDDDASGEDDGEQETVIGFADEEPGEDEEQDGGNTVIRRLRTELKERNKRIRELETSAPAPQKIEVGEKPTLAGLNYDEDAYEKAIEEWREQKAKVEAENAKAEEQTRAAQESWQADLQGYQAKQQKLGVEDFEEAEETIKSTLNLVQQAVIVKAADDPAAFVYALSKSATKMAELSKMHDPIKLAAAIVRMEGAVKVVKKRKAPAIDKPQSGSGGKPPLRGDKAQQLEKLEKEAEKSGDRTKLIQFKKANNL